jgi:hypothetical protein
MEAKTEAKTKFKQVYSFQEGDGHKKLPGARGPTCAK